MTTTSSTNELMLGTYDCIFKAIMLDPENRDYLKEIIHYVTGISLNELENIRVENIEHIINHRKNKKMQSDIIVSVGNRILNIEMNKNYYPGVFNKNSAYLQKIGASLYVTNKNYLDTKQIIQINFDNFSYFKENQEIYKFLYKEETSNIILPENTIKYHVDLAYIYDKCYNKPVENLSKFERCCLLLMAETKEFASKIAGNDRIMKKVYEKLESLNSDEQIIGLYDAEKEAERIKETQLLGAERKGMEKGIKQRNIEIAKNMLKNSVDILDIAKYTELTVEEIESLR